MIKVVTFEGTHYHPAHGRFEAGTGNIADAIGLGAVAISIGKYAPRVLGKRQLAGRNFGTLEIGTQATYNLFCQGTVRIKIWVINADVCSRNAIARQIHARNRP